jgi:hypothetical protein
MSRKIDVVLRNWSHARETRPLGGTQTGPSKEELRIQAQEAMANAKKITVCKSSNKKPDMRKGKIRNH